MKTQFTDPRDWRRSQAYEDVSVAGQFVALARDVLNAGPAGPNWEALARQYEARPHNGRLQSFAKSAVAAVGTDLWGDGDALALSDAYLRAFAPRNLIDAAKRFALTLPDLPVGARNVTYATGAAAYEVPEGAAKPLTRVTLNIGEAEAAKAVAMIVITQEVSKAKGQDAENFFRRLLRDAVVEASNEAFLQRIPRTAIQGGANAVESLRLGLAAVAASEGYVVAATHAATRELALAADGRMGVHGGEYIEGVVIIPALPDNSAGASMIVVPASALAIRDRGLELKSAGHASVEMEDAPTGDSGTPTGAQMVSLWQADSVGLMVERLFELRATAPAVEVS